MDPYFNFCLGDFSISTTMELGKFSQETCFWAVSPEGEDAAESRTNGNIIGIKFQC